MLSGFSNYDILDFIMTSDFVEGLNENEFIFLLKKSQKIIRQLKSNEIGMGYRMDELKQKISQLQNENKQEIINLRKSLLDTQQELQKMKTRRLTLKERLSGKIM